MPHAHQVNTFTPSTVTNGSLQIDGKPVKTGYSNPFQGVYRFFCSVGFEPDAEVKHKFP
jgi:hypothetical protein